MVIVWVNFDIYRDSCRIFDNNYFLFMVKNNELIKKVVDL